MSTRPASPPPVARWPYIACDVVLIALAWYVLSHSSSPPGIGAIIVAFLCVLIGIGLAIAPFLKEYEGRLRVAEAAARDANETQARRLAQTAEQLANAVSRSQSTEEQAGHALGTLEEMAEKLTAHAEELAQTITRSAEREQTSQKAEIERLVRERDDALAALDNRVSTVAAALAEVQAATKKAGAAHSKALDDIKHRLEELGARVASLSTSAGSSVAATVAAPAHAAVQAPEPAPTPVEEPATISAEKEIAATTPSPAPAAANAIKIEPVEKPAAPAKEKERGKPAPENGDHAPSVTPAAAPAAVVAPVVRSAPKAAPKPVLPELPLEGMPEPRPPVRHSKRDAAGVTSLVATAYIGIGNKLFLRGEGPGLSWDAGVPMQFLAIGKWGWTTTDAVAPVTCRVYRNDDTPMLDENIVIAPGAKSEIAPRF